MKKCNESGDLGHHFGGFTLIELLVTLSIVLVVTSFVVGINHTFISKNKINALVQHVINSIDTARSQALILGQDMTLTARTNARDWSDGMFLFVDNPTHQYQRDDTFIYSWHWQSTPNLQLVWHGFKSTKYLIFSADLSHSTANGHFSIVHDGIEVRRVIVNRWGAVRSPG
jgi:prepilin-type N-terminal cleavage/methylation domain-containing protein